MLSRGTISKPQANDWPLFAPFGLKPRCYRFNKTWPVRACRTEGGSPLHDSWATTPPPDLLQLQCMAKRIASCHLSESISRIYGLGWFQHCGFWFPFPPTCCHPPTSIFRLQHQLYIPITYTTASPTRHTSVFSPFQTTSDDTCIISESFALPYLLSYIGTCVKYRPSLETTPCLLGKSQRNSHTCSLDIFLDIRPYCGL